MVRQLAAGVRLLCLGASLLVPAAAAADDGASERSDWWHEANLQVVVHEHSFYRVTLNNIGCLVRVRLHFDAPFERYKSEDPTRNFYRFRAQLKLGDGRTFLSEPFNNATPGLRVLAFTHDSTANGCWAKEPHKLRKLDVNACRGKDCGIEAFK